MDSEHHRPDEFTRKKVPDNELQIYTWYGHECLAVLSNVMARADAAGRTRQFLLYKSMCVSARLRVIKHYSNCMHLAYSTQHTAISIQQSAYNTQHTTLGIQHSAYSTQHTAISIIITLGIQHSVYSTRHTALSMNTV